MKENNCSDLKVGTGILNASHNSTAHDLSYGMFPVLAKIAIIFMSFAGVIALISTISERLAN